MFDTNERKLERLNASYGNEMSERKYNLALGGCILYGLILTAIIVCTCADLLIQIPFLGLIVGFYAFSFLGIYITRSDNPFISFLGYHFVIIPVAALLTLFMLFFSVETVVLAMITTVIVVFGMIIVSSINPNAFLNMGSALFWALLIGLIAEIIYLLLGLSTGIFDWFFAILFSLYIGYDWCKAQEYPKTLDNAVDSAMDLYLDIINLFMRLLEIFGRSRD